MSGARPGQFGFPARGRDEAAIAEATAGWAVRVCGEGVAGRDPIDADLGRQPAGGAATGRRAANIDDAHGAPRDPGNRPSGPAQNDLVVGATARGGSAIFAECERLLAFI